MHLAEYSPDCEVRRRRFRKFKLGLAVGGGYNAQVWSLGRPARVEHGNLNPLVAQRTPIDDINHVDFYCLPKAAGTERQQKDHETRCQTGRQFTILSGNFYLLWCRLFGL